MTEATSPNDGTSRCDDPTQTNEARDAIDSAGSVAALVEDVETAHGIMREWNRSHGGHMSDTLLATILSEIRAERRRGRADGLLDDVRALLERAAPREACHSTAEPGYLLARVVTTEGFAGPCHGDVEIRAEPSSPDSGSSSVYVIHVDPSRVVLETIVFQRGPVAEGRNGVTSEMLLLILIDRLQGFQGGPLPSEFTATALTHLGEALGALRRRASDRIGRGVLGQMVP